MVFFVNLNSWTRQAFLDREVNEKVNFLVDGGILNRDLEAIYYLALDLAIYSSVNFRRRDGHLVHDRPINLKFRDAEYEESTTVIVSRQHRQDNWLPSSLRQKDARNHFNRLVWKAIVRRTEGSAAVGLALCRGGTADVFKVTVASSFSNDGILLKNMTTVNA